MPIEPMPTVGDQRSHAVRDASDKQRLETAIAKRSPVAEIRQPVSIVIPAYNAGRYIAEAIQSVLDQEYDPLELIVVDDGSTDDTAQIVRRFGGRVEFRQQANAGQSAAQNLGWSIARGSLLGYLGADDRLCPGAVAHVVAALQAHPSAVLAYPDYNLIDKASKQVRLVATPEYSVRKLYSDFHCITEPGVGGMGALFRRDAFQRAGGWSPEFRQVCDFDFLFRLALEGPFIRVPYVCADCRVHEGSTTSRAATYETADEPLRLVKLFFGRHEVPPSVRGWQRESTAAGYLLSAVLHSKSGRPAVTAARLIAAVTTSPGTTLAQGKAWAGLRIFASAVKRRLLQFIGADRVR